MSIAACLLESSKLHMHCVEICIWVRRLFLLKEHYYFLNGGNEDEPASQYNCITHANAAHVQLTQSAISSTFVASEKARIPPCFGLNSKSNQSKKIDLMKKKEKEENVHFISIKKNILVLSEFPYLLNYRCCQSVK